MFIPDPNRPMFSIPPPKGPSMPRREFAFQHHPNKDCLEWSWFTSFTLGIFYFLPGTNLPSLRTLGRGKMLAPLLKNQHPQKADLLQPPLWTDKQREAPEIWSDLPKVTELVSEKARTKSQDTHWKDWQVKEILRLKLSGNQRKNFMQGLRGEKGEKREKTIPKSVCNCTSF